jgi:hypothetical protein
MPLVCQRLKFVAEVHAQEKIKKKKKKKRIDVK